MQSNRLFAHIIDSLALPLADAQRILTETGVELTPQELDGLITSPDTMEPMPESVLAGFLNGLIDCYRGSRADEAGSVRAQQGHLSNNDVIKKIRIALNMHEADVREALKLMTIELTKSDLAALFRKPGHASYKVCDDELMMDFIAGAGQWKKIQGTADCGNA